MRLNLFFFLLFLSVIYLSLAQGSYEDCCLQYINKSFIKQRAVSYKIQELDGGCNIRAVLFKLRRGRVYCTDPNEQWVQELMNKLKKKFKRVQKPKKH